jgi:hypothetical protein
MNDEFESVYNLEEGKIYRYLSTSCEHKITIHDSFFKVINIIDKYSCEVYVYTHHPCSKIDLKRNTWYLYELIRNIRGPYTKDEMLAKII